MTVVLALLPLLAIAALVVPYLLQLWLSPAGRFVGEPPPSEPTQYRTLRGRARIPKVQRRRIFHWLKPKRTTGDRINGLGETERRQPTRIYHQEPGGWHPFLPVQLSFVLGSLLVSRKVGPFIMQAMAWMLKNPRPSIAPSRLPLSAEEWTRRIKERALVRCDVVGITKMDRNWIYQGFEAEIPERYRYIIVLGVAQDARAIARSPAEEAAVEVMAQYNRGTLASRALVAWLRTEGWDAIGHCGPFAGSLTVLPAALAAGLGELGKHGSIINQRYGPSIRFAYVLVEEMPLVLDRPAGFGADEFCINCQACTRGCPVDAISPLKQVVRGETKWYVSFDACVDYFNRYDGCTLCIAVCPYTYDDTRSNLLRLSSR